MIEHRIEIRETAWAELRDRTGTRRNVALATRLGMNHATVGRVMAGQCSVSAGFVANTLAAFPSRGFHELFEVVEVAR